MTLLGWFVDGDTPPKPHCNDLPEIGGACLIWFLQMKRIDWSTYSSYLILQSSCPFSINKQQHFPIFVAWCSAAKAYQKRQATPCPCHPGMDVARWQHCERRIEDESKRIQESQKLRQRWIHISIYVYILCYYIDMYSNIVYIYISISISLYLYLHLHLHLHLYLYLYLSIYLYLSLAIYIYIYLNLYTLYCIIIYIYMHMNPWLISFSTTLAWH